MPEITHELVKTYWRGMKSPTLQRAIDKMYHLKFHFDGFQYIDDKGTEAENPYFKKLILNKRPSESDTIKNYRKEIYSDETIQTTKKVLNTLKKIPKAQDWSVNYKQTEVPARVPKGETLQDYCEKNYPVFGNLTNWVFDIHLRKNLIDPDGLAFILPKLDVQSNEFLKPTVHYVGSDQVVEFIDGELAVIKFNTVRKTDTSEIKDFGLKIFNRNEESNELWIALPLNQGFTLEKVADLPVRDFPVWRMGGESVDMVGRTPVYNSFVHEMLPSLDKAARGISDLDGSTIMHLYPTMWYVGGQKCSTCMGTGKVAKKGGNELCGSCKGTGQILHSPFKDIEVKKSGVGEQQIPTPPAGFVEKDTKTLELQRERVEQDKVSALAAVNMEFLAKTPLNQSGKAKEVDKDELNTFVYDVSRHIVKTLNRVYRLVNDYRYMILIPNDETRDDMLPTINEAQDFSILTTGQMLGELSKAREAKVDRAIISEQEKDYAASQFKTQPITKGKIVAIIELNPFPGQSMEEVDNSLLAGTITKKDAVIATYINEFVEQAVEDVTFLDKTLTEQKQVISTLADAKILELNAVNPRPAE